MPNFVTFASSGAGGIGLVTSEFTLDRANRAVGIFVASFGLAAFVTPQFATSSGGTFLPLFRSDGTPFVVCSGGGGANVVESPPSPWMRLAISSAQTAITSVQIEAVLR